MKRTIDWDSNLVWHEGVEYRLGEMTPPDLADLEKNLRAAVTAIEAQLDGGHTIRGYVDEEWQRRAEAARTIKRRQADYIRGLILSRPAATREMSMSAALAQVSGRDGRLVERQSTAEARPRLSPLARNADLFVMAARMVLHPDLFEAIEKQAARLAYDGVMP